MFMYDRFSSEDITCTPSIPSSKNNNDPKYMTKPCHTAKEEKHNYHENSQNKYKLFNELRCQQLHRKTKFHLFIRTGTALKTHNMQMYSLPNSVV